MANKTTPKTPNRTNPSTRPDSAPKRDAPVREQSRQSTPKTYRPNKDQPAIRPTPDIPNNLIPNSDSNKGFGKSREPYNEPQKTSSNKPKGRSVADELGIPVGNRGDSGKGFGKNTKPQQFQQPDQATNPKEVNPRLPQSRNNPNSNDYANKPQTSNPVYRNPSTGRNLAPLGRGIGAIGGVGGLAGQGQQFGEAVDRNRQLQDEKRRLMEKYGLTSDEYDREIARYRPRYQDGELVQNPWEHDTLAPGGAKDALAARQRGMSPEQFKRERFGDQREATPLDPSGWKSPFNPGKIADKFKQVSEDEAEWQAERERNRKKWDTVNPNAPFEPRNPTAPDWGDWPPLDPFGLPPGQPGGAVPQEPLDHLSGFMVYVREDFKASFKVSEYGAQQGLTDDSNSSTSITKTFFRIDYDIFQSPSFEIVTDSLTDGTMLLSDSTGMYPSFQQKIYFKDDKGLGGGYQFFQFLYDFSSVLLTEDRLRQYKTLLGRNYANRFEYGIGIQVISFTNSVVAVVPQFNPGTRPNRRNSSPPKQDPPKPDPSEDEKMSCRYANDIEVQTTVYEYDRTTKTIKPNQEMVHTGINEFASRMSKQVAELARAVDKISDALDVPKYSQPAGKPILPQAFIDVVGPALFATGGLAALPAKTLPQEMLIFQALSHYLSGFQMLGKVPMSTDMTNPTAPTIMPRSAMGFNIMAHNNTTGLIGVPNDIKRVNDKGVSSNNSNKNATDAIEKTQALAESNAVDLSGIQNMLMSIIKQNEMLTLMVDESTAKVEMLVKDAGFKIDYEKREIPTVVSHMKKDDKGGKKSTPESSFNWDSVMTQGKATRLIPVWSKNNDVDKLQLGLKTNMSAQVAASSVLFPISKKGKAQFPNLKTKQTTDFDKWAFSLMKTEDLRDGGLSSVPKIEVISKGVTKAIIYQGPTIGKA